jgi:hypothetical protein
MKIIAISDTHIKGSIFGTLQDDLLSLLREADIIIHAGDFVSERAYEELRSISRLEAVHGNMDDFTLIQKLPQRKVIDADGVRIGIVHEAALSIQDTTGARYMAKEMGADLLVFGHIHKPLIEKSDVIIACPGSPTSPRLSEPSALELTIENGEISGRIVTFEGAVCGSIRSAATFGK